MNNIDIGYIDENPDKENGGTRISFLAIDDHSLKKMVNDIKKILLKEFTERKERERVLDEFKLFTIGNINSIDEVIDILNAWPSRKVYWIKSRPGQESFIDEYIDVVKQILMTYPLIKIFADRINNAKFTAKANITLGNKIQFVDSKKYKGVQIADLLLHKKIKEYNIDK